MKLRFVILSLALSLTTGQLWAATGNIVARVQGVQITDPNLFAGCMIELDADPESKLPAIGCSAKFLTMGCSGVFGPKDVAYRKFDLAQMAFALNKRVYLEFTDQSKADGYCLATRIDVLKD